MAISFTEAQAASSVKLTRAGAELVEMLAVRNRPVVTPFEMFRLIWRLYKNASGKKLYLRSPRPDLSDYARLRSNLKKTGQIAPDRDYGGRAFRVVAVSDEPAENIACAVDPTCYVSHLSAMQRWGLTDRQPQALILTRPDRNSAQAQLAAYMASVLEEGETNPHPLKIISHPEHVRRRRIHVYETKTAGLSLNSRGDDVRISTIGQTFLDMVQKPDLCGGMAHVIDVWEEHAATYLDDIVGVVDRTTGDLVKSRAGYILEERMKVDHPTIQSWKKLGQRGSSRKLDPSKPFASTFSETWMISLNA
jgi:predicted transcriptional regulator of viral defense system